MDFQIQASPAMERDDRSISIPLALRDALGVVVGQFLQLKGRTELVLQVRKAHDISQEVALVSEANFKKIQGVELKYKILEVTLGCDPEFFILLDNGLAGKQTMSASTMLPFQGRIGSDGCLGELRPQYTRHESELTANLENLIKQIPGKLNIPDWSPAKKEPRRPLLFEAHSYYNELPAGFHVHLGIPREILNTRLNVDRTAMHYLVRCLDWYVSVPLLLLEENHKRRLSYGKYGQPSDYRPSNVTLEYRTPGAFFLRSPTITQGLLGMSLMVTENVVSGIKEASKGFTRLLGLRKEELQEILPVPSDQEIVGTLKSVDLRRAKAATERIYASFQAFPNYGGHKESIERFFRAVEEQEKPGSNLLTNWKEGS